MSKNYETGKEDAKQKYKMENKTHVEEEDESE